MSSNGARGRQEQSSNPVGHQTVIGMTSQVTRPWPPDHVCDGSPDSVKLGAEIGGFRAHDERGIAKIGHLTLDKDIERTYPSRPSTPDRPPASPARWLAAAALCSGPTARVQAQPCPLIGWGRTMGRLTTYQALRLRWPTTWPCRAGLPRDHLTRATFSRPPTRRPARTPGGRR
jgi:hypothetical protein